MLVGFTGFVGSNLIENIEFDEIYNSKNIKDAYGKKPELLIYAGVKGTKFMANKFPEEDKINIDNAISNIKKINAKKLILISTVDVYDDLCEKNEDYEINPDKLHNYGRNRYNLERWVINNVENYHILRLPAIYGSNLKKNFIHDLINPCPKYVFPNVYKQIEILFPCLNEYYRKEEKVFIKYKEDIYVRDFFHNSKYNAIYFTDSNSNYQYLNLNILYLLIFEVIRQDIKILNCVTEQISSSELYKAVYCREFENSLPGNYINYNLRTKYKIKGFNDEGDDYLLNKEFMLEDIVCFIKKILKSDY